MKKVLRKRISPCTREWQKKDRGYRIMRVITVSLETMKIVGALPELEI
jgi:hypothetical protein